MSYLYMDLITGYLQWIVIRQRKQDLVMHSQLLQTDIRTVEAQWGKKAYEVAKHFFFQFLEPALKISSCPHRYLALSKIAIGLLNKSEITDEYTYLLV